MKKYFLAANTSGGYVNFYDENNKFDYCSAFKDDEMILESIN